MDENKGFRIIKIAKWLFCPPVERSFGISAILGFLASFGTFIYYTANDGFSLQYLVSLPFIGILLGLLCILPGILTLYNILYLAVPWFSKEERSSGQIIEYLTIALGSVCSLLWSTVPGIKWESNWWEQLYDAALHTPIATWTWPTLITVAAVAVIGYLILRIWRLRQLPPLVAVLAIGAMYLGAALCIVWCIQICEHDLLLCLFPINLILIAAKVIKEVIHDWHSLPRESPAGKERLILTLHTLLCKAQHWPWLGFLLALPLLGILISVLTLFGQAPDSIIQAWTQTSDWTFSQQVAPQNIYTDMHYLCTVAAGGHKKIVKPIRVGKRHGHRVLVNRQLCIANAFEQLLEERVPRIHRIIRSFYDKYGYPIAKHIRSPYTADAIWFLMKPLEWFFLTILYLFDKKPENRIAVQYPHAPLPEK